MLVLPRIFLKTLLPHALMHDVDFEAILFTCTSRPIGGDKKDMQGTKQDYLYRYRRRIHACASVLLTVLYPNLNKTV